MRVFCLGDTHGNAGWLASYVYPLADSLGCNAILQLGDFGYWEHTREGEHFVNRVDHLGETYQIPLFWLHGNHDKHSLALAKYKVWGNAHGFLECRPWVYYIPQGRRWTWDGVTFRAFGGAYSVDKGWRLEQEAKRTAKLNRYRASTEPVETAAETLWFPEEEMSDADMTALLSDYSGPVDVCVSHDFPAGANPGPHFKTLPECVHNQRRLQRALEVHQPKLWLHGHLHHAYVDVVSTGFDSFTEIVGLACDRDAAPYGWKSFHAWTLLDLDAGKLARHESDVVLAWEKVRKK